MKINVGLYMNAKRGYTGSGALNPYAVSNIEQLLRLRTRDRNLLSNLNIEVRLARDDPQHKRPVDDGMDTKEESHWKGAHEFDPLKIEGDLLYGPVGHPIGGDRARLLTKEALESFVTELRARDKDAENVLVLWGHADGPRGFLFSSYPKRVGEWKRDILSPLEVDLALRKSGQGLPALKFVCMDACQGACLEFASVLASHAEYFIASQTPVPGSGWNYGSWPAILNNVSAATWDATAASIAADFATSNPYDTSISVIRLKEIQNVLQQLRNVTQQFLNNSAARKKLVKARQAVPTYDRNLRGLVDLVALFDKAAELLGGEPGLASDCQALAKAMSAAIVASRVSAELAAKTPMNGCSIFFPTTESAFGDPWDEITNRIYFENPRQLESFKKTGWHELLKMMVPSVVDRPPMP